MSEPTNSTKFHYMQRLLDNQWIMLLLGILVPTVIYMLWGLYDVINIPVAP